MNGKIGTCLLAALLLAAEASPAVQPDGEQQETVVEKNQWKGKKVAFLGDSITDKQHVGTTKCYWEYLAELLGLEAFSYGINGNRMDEGTFRGRINRLMDYLKTHFPTKQVIVLTPLHRGFAQFSAGNVQPEEAYPNRIGVYVDEYVQALKEAGNVWAVPVIDLNSISGLYPMNDAQTGYFHRADTDRLHPNAEGHRRMALALMYQLLAFPASFD